MEIDLVKLEQRVKKLETKTGGIEVNALLNPISVDPQSVGFLKNFIALPYDTVAPTFTPPKNGYMRVVKTGGLYYLYCYVDGGWKRVQIT